jgi:hypothetical protein
MQRWVQQLVGYNRSHRPNDNSNQTHFSLIFDEMTLSPSFESHNIKQMKT